MLQKRFLDKGENKYVKLGNNHLTILDFRIIDDLRALCVLGGEILTDTPFPAPPGP
jgi:hypothetical protein